MFVMCDVMANSFFHVVSDWTAEFMNGNDFNPMA